MTKRENELRSYMTDEEQKALTDYEKKLKAIRDKAVKKEKAERAFWQAVNEREDEVYNHIMARRAERSADPKPDAPLPTDHSVDSNPDVPHSADRPAEGQRKPCVRLCSRRWPRPQRCSWTGARSSSPRSWILFDSWSAIGLVCRLGTRTTRDGR